MLPRWIRFAFLVSLISCLLFWVQSAVEIEATHEWQRIGENDTVAAGMHIRMDLTTGEKWVKLPDTEEEQVVAVAVDTQLVATGIAEEPPVATAEYDYAMMHRTLSKLPVEEQERMGLPAVLETSAASPTELRAWQETMKGIWERRQAELMELELADLPQLLKDRLAVLNGYWKDPSLYATKAVENDFNNVVTVLQDLEYQLSDIDMARDFFTLGGWPALVRCIRPHPNTTTTASTDIALHAAWALGSAVKHIEEFHPLVTSWVDVGTTTKTTAMDAILQELDKEETPEKLQLKLLYALGAMLRGNPSAQRYFLSQDGTKTLNALLHEAPKVRTRIIRLIYDLIVAAQHADADAVVVAQAFATPTWCARWQELLQLAKASFGDDYEAIVASMQGLEQCSWDTETSNILESMSRQGADEL